MSVGRSNTHRHGSPRTLILHVTAALGGGVAHSLSQLAKAQANDGYEVVVVYSIRPETPSDKELGTLFPDPIRRLVLQINTEVSPVDDLKGIFQLMKLYRQLQPTVIHLHSSKTGVLGRIASRLTGRQDATFYSPRGFSFLREDVGKLTRRTYIIIERFAAMFGGTIVACSKSEADLAAKLLHPGRLSLVENSVEMRDIAQAVHNPASPIRVATSGRLSYQKAPWNVREVARSIGTLAEFVWIGDGELRHELHVNGKLPENVTITGWKNRAGVIQELLASDIFLLPSLWEGMPLALIEAQAAGLPAVVLDIVGCRDVVMDGITGFVCRDVGELAAKVRLLTVDHALRLKMAANARRMAMDRFSVERMHAEMCAIYGIAGQPAQGQA
jgi:glycosyltransferase involved in cell wall biosynthesis